MMSDVQEQAVGIYYFESTEEPQMQELEFFCVNARLYPASVGWNLELTREIPTLTEVWLVIQHDVTTSM